MKSSKNIPEREQSKSQTSWPLVLKSGLYLTVRQYRYAFILRKEEKVADICLDM